jgi:hypothetical protein
VALSSWILQLKQHRSSIDVSKNIVVHVNDNLENGTIPILCLDVCVGVFVSVNLSLSLFSQSLYTHVFQVFFSIFLGARFETTRYVDWLNQSFSPPITANTRE